MSLNREYETFKAGPTTIIAFTAAATLIRLVTPGPNMKRKSFMLRFTTAARCLQGDSSITVTATSGMLCPTSVRWRIDVESSADAYISVIRDTANGNIEITKITETVTDDAPAAV